MQKELLGLISFFCSACPTSPILWLIASRPEPHITSFFSRSDITPLYEKEEILADSDEACEDVKCYLRDKFREIQIESIVLQELSQWPSEADLLKVARAAGGLFVYASTVVRYISDPGYGDPVRLLNDVLEIIERGVTENIWGKSHPMAQLDALYTHIMSKIPSNVMVDTRKILLTISYNHCRWEGYSLQFVCNMLGMAENAAYGATHHIRSIAKVPGPVEAQEDRLEFFHKSFPDYLQYFERSGFSPNLGSEAEQLMSRASLRVLAQAPDGVYTSNLTELEFGGGGTFKNGRGSGENVSVSWPSRIDDNRALRLNMFCEAVFVLILGLERGEEGFQSPLCLRVLTTCFIDLPKRFPYNAIKDYAFDACRRSELLAYGILKRVPPGTIDYTIIDFRCRIKLRLRGRIVKHRDPGNRTCIYEREGSLGGHSLNRTTDFFYTTIPGDKYDCYYCSKQFKHHFKTRQPGHHVTVLGLTPTFRLVELWFIDPDDGVSDLTYHFYVDEDQVHSEDDEDDGDNGDNKDDEDEDDESDIGNSETESEKT